MHQLGSMLGVKYRFSGHIDCFRKQERLEVKQQRERMNGLDS